MKIIPLYSLVIFPTQEQSDFVKSLKLILKNKIGWFGSANAAAHITVMNFEDDETLNLFLDQIRKFCEEAIPQNVRFNAFDSFDDKTFFVAPDIDSQKKLNKFIKTFHQYLGITNSNVHAHMSIARGLDLNRMRISFEFFKSTTIDFEFLCDALHLRKFNDQTKQYSDIIEKFELTGTPQPDLFS